MRTVLDSVFAVFFVVFMAPGIVQGKRDGRRDAVCDIAHARRGR